MFLAQVVPPDERPKIPADHAGKGWLCVVHKGETRWARPCFPMGQYNPPSDIWIKKNAEKYGVWVDEESENDGNPASHLIWFGFIPMEDGLDAVDTANFPDLGIQQWDRFKWVEDSRDSERTLSLFYTGFADDSDAPSGGQQPVLVIRQKTGSESIEIIHVKNGVASGTKMVFNPDKTVDLKIDGGSGINVTGKDGAAVVTVGDGAFNAAVFQVLETWWPTVASAHLTHTHLVPSGATGTAIGGLPSFPANAKSNAIKMGAGS